jgi:tetratricopeptide (TPR) repeat protein
MKIIVKSLIAIMLVFSSFSCFEKLEQFPTDAFASGTFWTSESNALIALTGMYRGNIVYGTQVVPSDWWTYCGIVFLEFATDNAYDRRGDNSTYNRLTDGTLLPNNNVINGYWRGSYRRIAITNDFLENIDNVNMPEEKKQRMISEAKFLRATQYFYLSQFWGAVPLVTNTLTPDEANNVEKSNKSVIVDFTIQELKEAVNGLPRFSNIPSSEIGRASKQAALAFLGRLYLAEKRFAEASEVYQQIINYGDNIIDSKYGPLFTTENENSRENIFSVQFVSGLAPNAMPQHAYPAASSGWHIINPLGSLAEEYGFDDGSPFSYDDPKFIQQDMGANRDQRFRDTFIWNESTFQGRRYICHPDSTQSVDQLTYSKQATRTGFGFRKFFAESFNGNLRSDYGGNIPIIRYAEVLLSYLEAELEAGNAITQDLLDQTINMVRGRPSVNLPPITEVNPDALRKILRRERRIELAFEGTRLWDIFRWEIGDEVLNGDFWGAPFPNSVRYPTTSIKIDPQSRWFVTSKKFRPGIDDQWPIPEAETNINPKLAQ